MAGGMDQLSLSLLQKAASDTLEQVMRGHPNRRAYVLIIASDGPHAGKTYAHSPMPNFVAAQFADALEHEADTVREAAQKGLMATAKGIVERQKIQGREGG